MLAKNLLAWLKVNVLCFVASAGFALFLFFLSKEAMLSFVRGWGAYSMAAGPVVMEQASREALLVNILAKNLVMFSLYFIASLIFIAPLLAIMGGVFYSLGLMSAIDRGLVPFWHSPVLIAIESTLLILTLSFASALGSEIFGFDTSKKSFLEFWKKNYKSLFPKQERDWKTVLKENKKECASFLVFFALLLVTGAVFEAYI